MDNIGAPANPVLAGNPIDCGLEARPDIAAYDPLDLNGTVVSASNAGKFKVMTLRNIGLTAPSGHNGFFATLKDIVHFDNTRDIDPMWGALEVALNVNVAALGSLRLTDKQEDGIVAFLLTLSDGWTAPPSTQPFP